MTDTVLLKTSLLDRTTLEIARIIAAGKADPEKTEASVFTSIDTAAFVIRGDRWTGFNDQLYLLRNTISQAILLNPFSHVRIAKLTDIKRDVISFVDEDADEIQKIDISMY